MTSSRDTANYHFRSREPKLAEFEEVFPASRPRLCRKSDRNFWKRHQVAENQFTSRGLRFVGHAQSHRRWWSVNGLWSMIGPPMLVVLLLVTCQCPASADGGYHLQPASVIQLGTCKAFVNHSVLDLDRLRRDNGSLRLELLADFFLNFGIDYSCSISPLRFAEFMQTGRKIGLFNG